MSFLNPANRSAKFRLNSNAMVRFVSLADTMARLCCPSDQSFTKTASEPSFGGKVATCSRRAKGLQVIQIKRTEVDCTAGPAIEEELQIWPS